MNVGRTGRTATARVKAARLLCSVAAIALPAGSRTRYLDEWHADLAADPGRAVAYAAGLLRSAVTLGLVLRRGRDVPVAIRCRLHLHRYVEVHDNPDDRSIVTRVCARCGRFRDGWMPQVSAVNDAMAWGSSQGIH